MDAYESDRAESGRKEIVKGIKYTLQKYQTAHDREIIDDMLMNFTGYTLETLVEKSIGYDYSQYDELEDFDWSLQKEGKSRKRLFFLGKKIPLITIRSVFSL